MAPICASLFSSKGGQNSFHRKSHGPLLKWAQNAGAHQFQLNFTEMNSEGLHLNVKRKTFKVLLIPSLAPVLRINPRPLLSVN
jgi:hypothetical protein